MLINAQNISATGWDESMQAPWFNTFDGAVVHQYWYDNPQSLSLKYAWAKANQLLGVGPYTFNDVAGAPAPFQEDIWSAFDTFMI